MLDPNLVTGEDAHIHRITETRVTAVWAILTTHNVRIPSAESVALTRPEMVSLRGAVNLPLQAVVFERALGGLEESVKVEALDGSRHFTH